MEDWYKVTYNAVVSAQGGWLLKVENLRMFRPILQRYGNSLVNTLRTIYPEHNWQLWRFTQVKDTNSKAIHSLGLQRILG